MPSLSDWSWICLMLMQAMLGNVSNNVRMITLGYQASEWHISFYIASESEDDRDDIDDTVSMFGAYMADVRDKVSPSAYATVRHTIVVTDGDLPVSNDDSEHVIFLRREP